MQPIEFYAHFLCNHYWILFLFLWGGGKSYFQEAFANNCIYRTIFASIWALGGSSGKGSRTGYVVIWLTDKLLNRSTSQTAAILAWHLFIFFSFHFAHFLLNACLPGIARVFHFSGTEKPKAQEVKDRSHRKCCPVPGGSCMLLKFIHFFKFFFWLLILKVMELTAVKPRAGKTVFLPGWGA